MTEARLAVKHMATVAALCVGMCSRQAFAGPVFTPIDSDLFHQVTGTATWTGNDLTLSATSLASITSASTETGFRWRNTYPTNLIGISFDLIDSSPPLRDAQLVVGFDGGLLGSDELRNNPFTLDASTTYTFRRLIGGSFTFDTIVPTANTDGSLGFTLPLASDNLLAPQLQTYFVIDSHSGGPFAVTFRNVQLITDGDPLFVPPAVIPEPSSFTLLALGTLALLGFCRRRQKGILRSCTDA
ncbi:MAG: PEP-CTERM sorting domain-containing protein [Planctomycetes bacterium]|nr:PEP-CTERM sorting domain-containing protein [Planctomycetota bacterium]